MSEPATPRDLNDIAIAWHVRVRNPALSRRERLEFTRWLSADPRHQAAYAEVDLLWESLAQPARTLGADGWHRRGTARRRIWPAAMAAGLAMLMVLASWWHNPGLTARWQADYATRPGEQRQIQLADGSSVFLDGDSALSFTQNATTRQATLLRGRAWFDVVRNEDKPFLTRQGDLEVRVLGTSFTLDTHGDTRIVGVESGRVSVFWKNRALSEQALTPGQQLRFRPGQGAQLMAQDVSTLSAWRNGLFVFDRVTLADVAATMESALGQRLILSPALEAQEISGVFQAGNPSAMLDGLTQSAELRTRHIPGIGLYLSR